jgi:hypothetical protein
MDWIAFPEGKASSELIEDFRKERQIMDEAKATLEQPKESPKEPPKEKPESPSLDAIPTELKIVPKYRRAASENRERNITPSSIWNASWTVRRAYDGYGRFILRPNKEDKGKPSGPMTATVVLLSEGHLMLAHKVLVSWRDNMVYPNKEDVRCSQWKLEEDGSWKATGLKCPNCIMQGRDPRLVVLWPLLDSRTETTKRTGTTKAWNMKYLVADNDAVQNSIWDGTEVYAMTNKLPHPTTAFAKFMVSRSPGQRSLSIGDSWTFAGYVDKAAVQVVEALPRIPRWDLGWPEFDDEILLRIAKNHRKVADKKHQTKFYSKEGAEILEKMYGAKGEESLEEVSQDLDGNGPRISDGLADFPDGGDGDDPASGEDVWKDKL